jgi:hypothetical protein
LAYAEYWRPALVWRIKGDAFLQVLASSRQCAMPQPRHPKGKVGDDAERGVVGMLCQAQQGFPKLAGCMQLCLYHIKPPQPKQDWGKLWRLAHLLAQLASPGVGLLHLGHCEPFGHLQCRTACSAQPAAV